LRSLTSEDSFTCRECIHTIELFGFKLIYEILKQLLLFTSSSSFECNDMYEEDRLLVRGLLRWIQWTHQTLQPQAVIIQI
jgi:hypothetical protein